MADNIAGPTKKSKETKIYTKVRSRGDMTRRVRVDTARQSPQYKESGHTKSSRRERRDREDTLDDGYNRHDEKVYFSRDATIPRFEDDGDRYATRPKGSMFDDRAYYPPPPPVSYPAMYPVTTHPPPMYASNAYPTIPPPSPYVRVPAPADPTRQGVYVDYDQNNRTHFRHS